MSKEKLCGWEYYDWHVDMIQLDGCDGPTPVVTAPKECKDCPYMQQCAIRVARILMENKDKPDMLALIESLGETKH